MSVMHGQLAQKLQFVTELTTWRRQW